MKYIENKVVFRSGQKYLNVGVNKQLSTCALVSELATEWRANQYSQRAWSDYQRHPRMSHMPLDIYVQATGSLRFQGELNYCLGSFDYVDWVCIDWSLDTW